MNGSLTLEINEVLVTYKNLKNYIWLHNQSIHTIFFKLEEHRIKLDNKIIHPHETWKNNQVRGTPPCFHLVSIFFVKFHIFFYFSLLLGRKGNILAMKIMVFFPIKLT